MNLCLCGCGELCCNKYKRGHGSRVNKNEKARSLSESLKKAYSTGERVSWNEGLTKKTDERVNQISIKNTGHIVTDKIKSQLSIQKRGKLPEGLAEFWSNPENRLVKSEAMKQIWAEHPEYFSNSSHLGIPWSDETKQRVNSYLVDDTYPLEFKKIKPFIIARDKNICQLCGKTLVDTPHIHHIDYNKQNCVAENLTSLCLECNVKVNFSRDYWKLYFSYKQNKDLCDSLVGGIDVDGNSIACVFIDLKTEELFSFTFSKNSKTSTTFSRFSTMVSLPIKKIFIEDPTHISFRLAAISLSKSLGILLNECEQLGIPVETVHPSIWKKVVINNGGASKDEISQFIDNKFPVLKSKNQDLKDACAIALYGYRRMVK